MQIEGNIAVVTGAGSGIGHAVCQQLLRQKPRAIAMVDKDESIHRLAQELNRPLHNEVMIPFCGDTTDSTFRRQVFDTMKARFGLVNICIPAAGITRDALATRVDKKTGKANIYPIEEFRLVTEVNLIAPIYWAMEMIAQTAEDRYARGLKKWQASELLQGSVIFIGSISSQGNKGQVSYATAKAGLEGAAATLTKEAIYHGIRCCVVHPGFTNTPMVQALGEDYIQSNILPDTQLGRLIDPQEIADAICFMITNPTISGVLWADAGWHPSPM